MLIGQLFFWWYSQGWSRVVADAGKRLVGISHLFSVPILLRTLGAPWRRIVTIPGASIDQRLRALGDNMVSRAIGFTVRLLVLITAGIMLLIVAVIEGLLIVLWPLVPPLIPCLIIAGVLL